MKKIKIQQMKFPEGKFFLGKYKPAFIKLKILVPFF